HTYSADGTCCEHLQDFLSPSVPQGRLFRLLFFSPVFWALPQKPSLSMSPPSRGVAQPGSAFVWGTKGRRFKSGRSDHSHFRSDCAAGINAALPAWSLADAADG